ncbi:hypothetical protein J41TS12_38600 [Paenibacillus antibioticophila]|uniref:Stage III sporulation protein AF n=1 Tax=Paenibacillus antibioticophila TaxID=1274374 RepID=A0A919XVZ3_9BACL|nr:stage III sporulation protein AF [Paenibacillus antibioticophila]GIO38999.1 hypothetical protein J41TS12_38600 [Paenibacillus antibioticophila]
MSMLGEWLKEIIIIVLFAVFIDLLLPNRAMERYVKFVVSLLILLTLLSPVMRILSGSEPEKMIAAAFDQVSGSVGGGTEVETESILKQGELLRKKQEAEALQLAGDQAAAQMKQQIELETGQPVERVMVILAREDPSAEAKGQGSTQQVAKGTLYIEKVEVVMKVPEQAASESSDKSIKVRKVDVSLPDKIGRKTEDTLAVSGLSYGDAESPANSIESAKLTESIQSLMVREWGISADAVTVIAGVQEER